MVKGGGFGSRPFPFSEVHMAYTPTGNPRGRPRKVAPIEAQPSPQRRERKEGLPKSKRNFVAMFAPEQPRASLDTHPPMMGQRKRKKARRAKLLPNPVSV